MWRSTGSTIRTTPCNALMGYPERPKMGLPSTTATLVGRPGLMERKGWLGADLVFDIDGDHLDTEACRESKVVSLACLEDAKEEANKLIDVLTEELGLKPTKVVFSGNRGFHVHVVDEEVLALGQKERRELVNYLKAVGFDPSKFHMPMISLRGSAPGS